MIKFDGTGEQQWTVPLALGLRALAVDPSGDAYVAGGTDLSDPRASTGQAVLMKYDAAGHKLWSRQHGSIDFDAARDVAIDSGGTVYVAGSSSGDVDGNVNRSGTDSFVVKYDSAGNLM